MTITAAEKPADLSLVRRLADPREKLRRTAAVIEEAEKSLEARRLRRNAAAVLIFRKANAEAAAKGLPSAEWPMQPAAMWRDTIRVSRSGFHKIMGEADPGALAELRKELDDALAELAELPTERAGELPRLARERDKLIRRIARHEAQLRAIEELQAEIAADPEMDRRLLAIAREEAEEVRRLEQLIAEAIKLRDEIAVPLLNGTHGQALPNAEVGRLANLSSPRVAQLRNMRFV